MLRSLAAMIDREKEFMAHPYVEALEQELYVEDDVHFAAAESAQWSNAKIIVPHIVLHYLVLLWQRFGGSYAYRPEKNRSAESEGPKSEFEKELTICAQNDGDRFLQLPSTDVPGKRVLFLIEPWMEDVMDPNVLKSWGRQGIVIREPTDSEVAMAEVVMPVGGVLNAEESSSAETLTSMRSCLRTAHTPCSTRLIGVTPREVGFTGVTIWLFPLTAIAGRMPMLAVYALSLIKTSLNMPSWDMSLGSLSLGEKRKAHGDGVETMLHGQQSVYKDLLSLLHGIHVLKDYIDLLYNSLWEFWPWAFLGSGEVLCYYRQLLSVIGCIDLSTFGGGDFSVLFAVNHGK
ncbi:hypothetical protein Acr_12g0000270 [Actinidia rufa]|uniref:Uncharacterized protein n=1 Tax=Actinidia rufa TaxID=165716 RepID=A0A7J0FGC6_9ERIC|nr:hypothetical protein Acr_12g0000270 [Actinidia rufa]